MKDVSTKLADADLQTSEQVAGRLCISVRTLWRMVKAGTFPGPVRWNRKLVRWKKTAVDEAISKM